jgi:hypothetical protein
MSTLLSFSRPETNIERTREFPYLVSEILGRLANDAKYVLLSDPFKLTEMNLFYIEE